MSSIPRPSIELDPPNVPPALPAALVMALSRSFAPKLSWSLPRILLAGIPTGGILPIICMTNRFDDYSLAEAYNLRHLAEWLRLDLGDPESAQLAADAQHPHTARHAWLACGLAVLALAAAVRFFTFANVSLDGWLALLRFRSFTAPQAAPWSAIFCALAAAAALVWLYQVNVRAAQVRRFALTFNRIMGRQDLAPVPVPRTQLGLWPAWLGCGILLAWFGAIWGLPLMLAAAAHRRYIVSMSRPMRAAMGDRVRRLLSRRRPALIVPTPSRPRARCTMPRCRTDLPAGAIFCPRCGSPTT